MQAAPAVTPVTTGRGGGHALDASVNVEPRLPAAAAAAAGAVAGAAGGGGGEGEGAGLAEIAPVSGGERSAAESSESSCASSEYQLTLMSLEVH